MITTRDLHFAPRDTAEEVMRTEQEIVINNIMAFLQSKKDAERD